MLKELNLPEIASDIGIGYSWILVIEPKQNTIKGYSLWIATSKM